MAKCNVVLDKEVFESVKEVNLSLTLDEARTLLSILYIIGGDRNSLRKYSNSVLQSLEDEGIAPYVGGDSGMVTSLFDGNCWTYFRDDSDKNKTVSREDKYKDMEEEGVRLKKNSIKEGDIVRVLPSSEEGGHPDFFEFDKGYLYTSCEMGSLKGSYFYVEGVDEDLIFAGGWWWHYSMLEKVVVKGGMSYSTE